MTYQMYYNRLGEPITDDEYMELWTQPFEKSRRVANDERGDVRVSTVWLGMDHNYGDGPPLIFETMIFGGDHDDETWRYATEVEAVAGHRVALALAFEGGD